MYTIKCELQAMSFIFFTYYAIDCANYYLISIIKLNKFCDNNVGFIVSPLTSAVLTEDGLESEPVE